MIVTLSCRGLDLFDGVLDLHTRVTNIVMVDVGPSHVSDIEGSRHGHI